MKEHITHSAEETAQLAVQFLGEIMSAQKQGATVVALQGNLGSGKTTFTQAIARELGVVEQVTSPTFVIQKIYTVVNNRYSTAFAQLIHIDAYRIEDPSELEIIGFKKLLTDPKKLILIEWPEKVGGLLPTGARTIHFRFIDETTRGIK